jgi:hypothetical protein
LTGASVRGFAVTELGLKAHESSVGLLVECVAREGALVGDGGFAWAVGFEPAGQFDVGVGQLIGKGLPIGLNPRVLLPSTAPTPTSAGCDEDPADRTHVVKRDW